MENKQDFLGYISKCIKQQGSYATTLTTITSGRMLKS